MRRGIENRVLVVNGAPDQVEMMELLLNQSGYSVLTAYDGQEGLNIARKELPDLIISDVAMARLDGIAMCRLIREDPELHLTPILFVGAVQKDSESVLEAFRVGADDYIEAPYHPVRLIAKVTRLLERRRAEDAECKSAEVALRKQKELLQKIFDHIPVLLIFWGADRRLKLVNREWERVRGWSLDEVKNKEMDALAESSFDLQDRQRVQDFIASSNGEWADFKIRGKDGRVTDTAWANIHLSDGTIIGIGQDITERKRAEEELKSSNEMLRALSARLQSVREEESLRIAREIHDELGGALTGLKLDLSWLTKRLGEPLNEAAAQKLKSVSELIDETIQKIRNISTELRPAILDDLGLAAAIEWQTREFQERTEIECKLTSLPEEVALGPEKATAVFRIFQEILTNIARHARATSVEIWMQEQDDDLILKVTDNGRGIKDSEIADTKSLGLLGMQERAVIFGGQVSFIGSEERGTTVTVRIPRE